MADVAALFLRKDSNYKAIAGVDCWDKDRDARLYAGNLPVIVHPPCADYCRLSHLYPTQPDRAACAYFALQQVRRCGGILEHPAFSKFFYAAGLPVPGGLPDEFGGWSLSVRQWDFGHVALKPTWLYFCGIARARVLSSLPQCRPTDGTMSKLWRGGSNTPRALSPANWIPGERRYREYTPDRFAAWLVSHARAATAPKPSFH